MGAALGIAGMGSRQRPGPPARVGVTAKAAKHCPEAVVGVAWSGTGGVDTRRAHCGRFDAHERRAEPLARTAREPRYSHATTHPSFPAPQAYSDTSPWPGPDVVSATRCRGAGACRGASIRRLPRLFAL